MYRSVTKGKGEPPEGGGWLLLTGLGEHGGEGASPAEKNLAVAQGVLHPVLGLLPRQDHPRVALDAVPSIGSQERERPFGVVGRGDHNAAFGMLAEGKQRRCFGMLETHTMASHLDAGLAEAQLAKPSGHLTISDGCNGTPPVWFGLFGLPLTLTNEGGEICGDGSETRSSPLVFGMRVAIGLQEAVPVNLQPLGVGAVEVKGVNP